MEEWKQIDGYEFYEVSSHGNVRNIETGKTLTLFDNNGYLIVKLSRNGKKKNHRVHRLVANAFIPNPHNKRTVNHKDHNRQNNHVDNLEWATDEEQCNKEWKQKVYKKIMLFDEENCKVIVFQSGRQCANYLGVHVSTVGKNIKRGYKCKGYKLKYVD